MPDTKIAVPKQKTNAPKTKQNKLPLSSAYTDWVDKQEIMQHFHLSSRTLQNLRNRNDIVWSHIGGKIYYNIASFTALLERNRRG